MSKIYTERGYKECKCIKITVTVKNEWLSNTIILITEWKEWFDNSITKNFSNQYLHESLTEQAFV